MALPVPHWTKVLCHTVFGNDVIKWSPPPSPEFGQSTIWTGNLHIIFFFFFFWALIMPFVCTNGNQCKSELHRTKISLEYLPESAKLPWPSFQRSRSTELKWTRWLQAAWKLKSKKTLLSVHRQEDEEKSELILLSLIVTLTSIQIL